MKWTLGNSQPLAARIRQFFEQLFTSRHVKFLEAELVRTRADKDSQIQQLREEKRALEQFLGRPVPPAQIQPPMAIPQMPLGKYETELQAHIAAMEQDEAKEN